AVRQARCDLFGVDAVRDHERAAIVELLVYLPFERELALLEADGDVLLRHAGQVGEDQYFVLVLVDVDGGRNRRARSHFLGSLVESVHDESPFDHCARTAIWRGCASGAFGSVSVSTPSFMTAVLFSTSTLQGSAKLCANFKNGRSWR